jgi:hypothetical protein
MERRNGLISRFRLVLGGFVLALVVSGVTAFPLLWEVETLARLLGIAPDADYRDLTGLQQWIAYVRDGLRHNAREYPFMAYGTDWLAFGHIVIALFFIEPLVKPTQGRGNLIVGMVACALVVPLALVCGPLRGIPFYWQLVDCSFGVLGLPPLLYCYRLQGRLREETAP